MKSRQVASRCVIRRSALPATYEWSLKNRIIRTPFAINKSAAKAKQMEILRKQKLDKAREEEEDGSGRKQERAESHIAFDTDKTCDTRPIHPPCQYEPVAVAIWDRPELGPMAPGMLPIPMARDRRSSQTPFTHTQRRRRMLQQILAAGCLGGRAAASDQHLDARAPLRS